MSGSFGMYVFTVTGGECDHSCWSPVWDSVSMHSCWLPVQSSVSMHSCWSPVKGALPVLQSMSTYDVSTGPVCWPSINTPWSSWSPWQAYRGNIAVGIYHHAVTRVTYNVMKSQIKDNLVCSAGTAFISDFSTVSSFRWKFNFSETLLQGINPGIISLQKFVHATMARLLCYVQNFIKDTWKLGWEQN